MPEKANQIIVALRNKAATQIASIGKKKTHELDPLEIEMYNKTLDEINVAKKDFEIMAINLGLDNRLYSCLGG